MYGYESDVAVNVVMGMVGFILVVYVVIIAFSILSYVLQSLGMYTIAKRREIKKPWLAWIPVLSGWTLGSIDDQYQYVAKGKTTNRRKWLLGLGIANWVLGIVASGVAAKALLEIVSLGASLDYMTEEEVMRLFLPIMGKMTGLSFFASVMTIVLTVFKYIALYGLYTSCDPKNNVMYLVLSIVFSVTIPFFVVACRNKDLGMPPRRVQIPGAPTQNDPWQTNP